MIALSAPVFSLFFQGGRFDYDSTIKTAQALRFYALGLAVIGGIKIVVPAFYAMQDMKTPVRAAFAAFIANIVLSLLLMGPLLHGGLALATTISSLLNLIILLFLIKKRLGKVLDKGVVRSLCKSISGAVLTFLTAYFVAGFGDWRANGLTAQKVLTISAAICAGAGIYFLSALFMKSEEMDYVKKIVMRKR